MLLIIQLILIYFAWKNGWGATPILGLVAALILGFFLAFIGMPFGALLFVDILLILALILFILVPNPDNKDTEKK